MLRRLVILSALLLALALATIAPAGAAQSENPYICPVINRQTLICIRF